MDEYRPWIRILVCKGKLLTLGSLLASLFVIRLFQGQQNASISNAAGYRKDGVAPMGGSILLHTVAVFTFDKPYKSDLDLKSTVLKTRSSTRSLHLAFHFLDQNRCGPYTL